MLTLIQNGEVYTPSLLGTTGVLLAGDRVLKIGTVDADRLRALDVPCSVVDASDCWVLPGFIDPHEHLIGAGGEQGWATRLGEVAGDDLLLAGITTVVGCLGTDTTTRSLAALLAKTQALADDGLSAYMLTGGFPVPPPTLTGSVTDDIALIANIVGVGEIAIADERSSQPTLPELARLVVQARTGGRLANKAGVTHFHVGPGRQRLALLHALVDEYELPAASLYPTHISRSTALMDDAIALAKRGAFVDIDTVEDDLEHWLQYYHTHDGPPHRLTVSSDAHTPGGSPQKHWGNWVRAVHDARLPMDDVLPCFTTNPAQAVGLQRKGRLAPGLDADLLVVERATCKLVHVWASGRQVVKDGHVICQQSNLNNDNCVGIYN